MQVSEKSCYATAFDCNVMSDLLNQQKKQFILMKADGTPLMMYCRL